jgi:uncharacterized protein (TIGR02147 family)
MEDFSQLQETEKNQTMDMFVFSDFSLWLQKELINRCKKNPNYSLRAFARYLSVDPSSLSQYISKKRIPSAKMKIRIAKKVGVTQSQLQAFSDNSDIDEVDEYYKLIELDKFHYISDWYHIAILELSNTDGFSSNPQKIASRLGITTEEVKVAIERMIRLNLVKKVGDSIEKSNQNLSNFCPGETSAAHKLYQKQIIEKALKCVDECPAELKDITSISMAIDVDKLPQARKMIYAFRKKMCQFLENDKQAEVYNLSVQLFPISKVRND